MLASSEPPEERRREKDSMGEKSIAALLKNRLTLDLVGGFVSGAAVGSLATLGVIKATGKLRTLATARAEKQAARLQAEAVAAAKQEQARIDSTARMRQRLNWAFERLGLNLRAEVLQSAASATAAAAAAAATSGVEPKATHE